MRFWHVHFFTIGAVTILRKQIPNCLSLNGNSMPLWQVSLSLRRSDCSIENSSINRLDIIRAIANPSTHGILKRHLDQQVARGVIFSRILRLRLGNGALKHPPSSLPNPVVSISLKFVSTLIFTPTAVFLSSSMDSLLHAVLLEAALERFHPRRFTLPRGRRITVDSFESCCLARLSLFEIAPQEEQFLTQGV